jgi:hypothetical protein
MGQEGVQFQELEDLTQQMILRIRSVQEILANIT